MMMVRSLFAIVLLAIATFASARPWILLDSPHRPFDYFLFSLQWPGTICSTRSSCCQHLSHSPGFTIHGIWPEYNNGGWPQCCNGPSFDDTKITTLADKLRRSWPSLYCGSSKGCHGTNVSFWGHEWEKHGTCAWPVMQNEYDYFSIALRLYERYDLLDVLMQAGITPLADKYYNASSVVTAVSEAFGAIPTLVCSNGRLEEIRLCFTKELKARDCGQISEVFHKDLGSANSCPQQLLVPPLLSSQQRKSSVMI